jgi:hypothetical protein
VSIAITDLKWKQSQRLTDNDDGGGRMTGTVVVDGVVNNLLPNLSRTDRTGGVVTLRKMFGHVSTGNIDVYAGATAAVMAPPADPNVSLLLFKTDDPADVRSAAQERIERYLGLGTNTGHTLYGDHYQGQRTLTLMLANGAPTPVVGDTLVLRVSSSGATEYVRISDVTTELRSFTTYEGGNERTFKKTLATLSIYSELRSDYVGEEPSYFPPSPIETRVYNAIVADAARYYGISRLTEAAAVNDLVIQVDSIFSRVVPATESEIPVLDARASADLDQFLAAGDPYTVTRSSSGDTTLYEAWFDRAIAPGSVQVNLKYGSNLRWQLRDDGAGNLVTYSGGTTQSGASIGFATVAYDSGRVQVSPSVSMGSGTWSVEITATPAGLVAGAGRTELQAVTLANRGYIWVRSLNPKPAPGVLAFSYRALGRWYTLKDNGRGQLTSGVVAEGTGTIDYTTGTAALTTGYLPDVDTSLLWQWGSAIDAERVAGAGAEIAALVVRGSVFQAIVPGAPGDFSIQYLAGGVTKTVSDDGAGNLTGDGTGQVFYGEGAYVFTPTYLPDSGSALSIEYQKVTRNTHTESNPVPDGSGDVSIALGGACEPLSVSGRFEVENDVLFTRFSMISFRDDGAGNLLRELYYDDTGAPVTGEVLGTVNYTTGAVVIGTTLQVTYKRYDNATETWVTDSAEATLSSLNNDITVYSLVPGGVTTDTETPAVGSLQGQLIRSTGRKYVVGSARLTVGGQAVIDRNGTLLRSVSAANGVGTPCGTVNELGEFNLTSWTGGGSNTLAVTAALAQNGVSPVLSYAFRVPVPVLRPSSLTVRATRQSPPSESTATSDAGGNVNGGIITGTVDYDSTLVELTFSSPVVLTSIYYSAVGVKYVPLSEDILHLDPVRLPQDGRVPHFRPADFVVIHHTDTDTLSAPLIAGQTVNLSRGPISKLWLHDENGVEIPEALYTADLAATPATITFADPLDLSAYQQPLVATHRIEQQRLIEDVGIGGQIKLFTKLTANFPADETYVSTLVRFGDLQARVAYLFTQKTWGGTWSDERDGDDSLASYNDVIYPVEVLNRNAITERWAVIFTNATDFYVLGEYSGVVATGSTAADCAPINPYTGEAYFRIRHEGWGAGWVNNNVLRFNTVGAIGHVWVIRTVQAGEAVVATDQGRVELRGDAD